MAMEYKVVYDHAGYQLEAGQNGWIPDRRIAERILNNKQSRQLFRDCSLYLIERPSEKTHEPCRTANGRIILNSDHFYVDALEVGDLVEEEIVQDFMDCLPPACMRGDCAQLGEPFSLRIDKDGRTRNTYLTFKSVGEGTWEYCGDCFRGVNVINGERPDYI